MDPWLKLESQLDNAYTDSFVTLDPGGATDPTK